MSTTLERTSEQFAALAARQADAPVVMVNLLKFKTSGGVESYQRCGQEVAPHVERVGATVRYLCAAPEFVIAGAKSPGGKRFSLSSIRFRMHSSAW